MKKCPVCKAEIEDNAHFCLYCMTSLAEKETIEIKRKKSPALPFVICAVLFVLLVIAVMIFTLKCCGGQANTHRTPSGDTSPSGYSGTAAEDATQLAEGVTSAKNPADTEEPTSSNNPDAEKPLKDETEGAKDTKPETDTEAEKETEPNTEKPQNPEVSSTAYIYRKAQHGDDFSVSYPIPENGIVITGVSQVSADGVYRIPEYIDGKEVIAVMGLAFCHEDIAPTVKKVVIPSTVKTIWNYAFYNCRNLTDIYLCPSGVYTESQAFAPKNERKASLTIHASHSCSDRDMRYYRNSAAYYDAEFKEWNGGALD